MALQLRVLLAFPENPSLVPNLQSHSIKLTHIFKSSFI